MKWMVLFLLVGVSFSLSSQTYGLHNISLKSGYFATVGISAEWVFPPNHGVIGTFGYRLPGGWLSIGNNTRLGGTIGWSFSKKILKNKKDGLSFYSFIGTYGADVSFPKKSPPFPKHKWFSFGLLIGGGVSLDWKVLHFAINLLPGYEWSGQPEWHSNWFFWKGTSLSVGIKWNN